MGFDAFASGAVSPDRLGQCLVEKRDAIESGNQLPVHRIFVLFAFAEGNRAFVQPLCNLEARWSVDTLVRRCRVCHRFCSELCCSEHLRSDEFRRLLEPIQCSGLCELVRLPLVALRSDAEERFAPSDDFVGLFDLETLVRNN